MPPYGNFSFENTAWDEVADYTDHLVVTVTRQGGLSAMARRVNAMSKGAIKRVVEHKSFQGCKAADVITISYPSGLKARAIQLVILERGEKPEIVRKAGVTVAKRLSGKSALILLGALRHSEQFCLGLALRSYKFQNYKSKEQDVGPDYRVMHDKLSDFRSDFESVLSIVDGVCLTRDLVSMPANILTTETFAEHLLSLTEHGLKVEVLNEDRLKELGMGALLSVGQGSKSPSKLVILEWQGAEDAAAPLALAGKGVVFDTGGISMKPAAGMEEMTMDMGGAGVVAGTMLALAKRKAKANVVGLVGLVENMPSGEAMRPGDVVTSLKGDTIEVLNTDAEGRLVLCDVMWYAQDRFQPCAMIDLATLTGAIIVGLGHENAGVFSNNDKFCSSLLGAAAREQEGAWRMPLSPAYDKLLKSPIADMKNIGGRAAGSITAAQFLQRFVKDELPWAHIDIAGVAKVKTDTAHSGAGATGWGVMTLNRLVQEMFETG